MSKQPRSWTGRDRRPIKNDPQRQDVLLVSWRDDEGNLHRIPGVSCDIRNGDVCQRAADFDNFVDRVKQLIQQHACAIHVFRVREGVEREIGVLGNGVRSVGRAWNDANRKGYGWDDL